MTKQCEKGSKMWKAPCEAHHSRLGKGETEALRTFSCKAGFRRYLPEVTEDEEKFIYVHVDAEKL